MVQSLSVVQQKTFDAEVKADYQSRGGLIKPYVYVKNGIVGNTVDFRKVGQLQAYQRTYQDNATPQDPGYSKVTATMLPYDVFTLTDRLEQLLVNFDDRREETELHAMAILRRQDQIIIDSLVASSTPNTIAADFGSSSGNTNLTFAKIQEITRIFDAAAVPIEDRTLLVTASQSADLYGIEQFTRSEFTNLGPSVITNGSMDNSRNMGMRIIIVPTMLEGGLPATGTVRSCYAFHKRAVGMGISQDMRTEVGYLYEKFSWSIGSTMQVGATAIDTGGIIEILCDEA